MATTGISQHEQSQLLKGNNNATAVKSESELRIEALSQALQRIKETTAEAGICCDGLTGRARHLDSLTSPASDASAMLTQASTNLGSTLAMMKDARERFDTVADCEPAISRLLRGAKEDVDRLQSGGVFRGHRRNNGFMNDGDDDNMTISGGALTEQDVYAAGDSMEIIRDAYAYFLDRRSWKSTPSALGGLERVHQMGVDAMCLLITGHLKSAGPAVRMKRTEQPKSETPNRTRARLGAALQNRDLMKTVGEYEENLPLSTRAVRELRAMFECLGGDGYTLGPCSENKNSLNHLNPAASAVVRTEKIGSGCFCKLTKQPLQTGYPHLDAYADARKTIAYKSLEGYYRHLKDERKMNLATKRTEDVAISSSASENALFIDAAARDAVRALEQGMVIVAGEKSIYRCVISPTSSHTHDDRNISLEYKTALVSSYSYVVSGVVDRIMDIIEVTFMKDIGISMMQAAFNSEVHSSNASIRYTASGAAACLRILDGVRMLGPSLAKLCEIAASSYSRKGADRLIHKPEASLPGQLCICIHRVTVKNCARALEFLAKAISNDPLDGEKHRPVDARVSIVSSEVVRAIRLVAPFVSAYKSVTKRRALPWDQNIGEDAGDMVSFIKFLIMRLLHNLQGKALNYTKDPALDSQAKSNLFMMNNTFYLLEQLGADPNTATIYDGDGEIDGQEYKVEGDWFVEKVGKMFDTEKNKYLKHWQVLNNHLSSVNANELSYQKDNILTLESGRLLKSRFSGFMEDFEKTISVHRKLTVIDPNLKSQLLEDVKKVFLPRYTEFYDNYSKIQFSKKNMEQYLKYPPKKVDSMIDQMYQTI